MHHAAIALGSNLASPFGDREANLREAVIRIGELGEIKAVSPLYDTEPLGYHDQPRFLNAALLLQTSHAPTDLLRILLRIEKAMGRDRSLVPSKGPRVIDLDLLFFDDLVLHTPELILPHPAMGERRFVLEPLAAIAPTLRHPLNGFTVAEMLAQLTL